MLKELKLASLLNSPYKKLITMLATIFYYLNKAKFFSEVINDNINKQ